MVISHRVEVAGATDCNSPATRSSLDPLLIRRRLDSLDQGDPQSRSQGGNPMNGRRTNSQHPEDLPWNDVPEDSSVIPGTEEPAPAEVFGDDDEEHDVAGQAPPDPDDQYRRRTLRER